MIMFAIPARAAQSPRFHCTILALAICTSPSTLSAQESAITEKSVLESASKDSAELNSRIVASSGPVDREASGFGGGKGFSPPVFELSSSDNLVVGTMAIGYTRTTASFTETSSDRASRVSSGIFKFGLEASVPFNGAEKDDVIDFRNIGNDAEMTVTATWMGSNYAVSASQMDNINRAYQQCFAQAIKGADGIAAAEGDAFLSNFDILLRKQANNPMPAQDLAEALTPTSSALFKAIEAPCFERKGGEDIFRTYGEAALGQAEYRRALRRRLAGSLKFFGAQATLGYGTHNVINRAGFSLDQENRVGIDGRVYAGIISNDGRKSGRISVGYARGYAAQDSVNFCRPDASGIGETCISGEDGRPVRSENSYVSVEGRLGFGKTDIGPPQFAIAPQVTYRVEDNDFLFDLPVYLVRQADTGLSGGIRAAFDTGKNDFTMRVFVGVPFSTWF